MPPYFHHERLVVYQRSIEFVAWAEDVVQEVSAKASAKDHLRRASGSVPQNIAEGNAKRSAKEQRRFIDIANGSALECAACLDVLGAKELLARDTRDAGKDQLQAIVRMLYGLRRAKTDRVAEEAAGYGAHRFDHETLEAYQKAMDAVAWLDQFCRARALDGETSEILDRTSTSTALNIAEGNAKFRVLDRCKFLDASVSACLRCAGRLDVLVARKTAETGDIDPGKEILSSTLSLLLGLRTRLLGEPPDWEDEDRGVGEYDKEKDND